MIYIESGRMKMLILDPAGLRLLERGKALLSPDQTVGLFYSPDPEWLARKISTAQKGNRLDAETLTKLLALGFEQEPPFEVQPSIPLRPMSRPAFLSEADRAPREYENEYENEATE